MREAPKRRMIGAGIPDARIDPSGSAATMKPNWVFVRSNAVFTSG